MSWNGAVPAEVERFIADVLSEEPAPKDLKERNWRQLVVVERVRSQWHEIDPVDALIWVSVPYRTRFPQ